MQVEPVALRGVALSAVAFSGEFPGFAQRALRFADDEGVRWRIAPSFGAGIDYFPVERAAGLFVGVVVLQFRNKLERSGDRSSFQSLNIIPRVGYRYFPFAGSGLYVTPFAGPRFEFKIAGSNTVDGAVFEPTRIAPFATVHVGVHL